MEMEIKGRTVCTGTHRSGIGVEVAVPPWLLCCVASRCAVMMVGYARVTRTQIAIPY